MALGAKMSTARATRKIRRGAKTWPHPGTFSLVLIALSFFFVESGFGRAFVQALRKALRFAAAQCPCHFELSLKYFRFIGDVQIHLDHSDLNKVRVGSKDLAGAPK